jgi:glycosyltransferase involved in cell wall biosynthesis
MTVSASVYRDLDGKVWPNSELLGLTLLESMAVGTAVVCTDVGGMPEYVVDGTTGFIVPPNDAGAMRAAVQRLIGDSELARRMAAPVAITSSSLVTSVPPAHSTRACCMTRRSARMTVLEAAYVNWRARSAWDRSPPTAPALFRLLCSSG